MKALSAFSKAITTFLVGYIHLISMIEATYITKISEILYSIALANYFLSINSTLFVIERALTVM